MLDNFDYTYDTVNTGPRSYAQDFPYGYLQSLLIGLRPFSAAQGENPSRMKKVCTQCRQSFEITQEDLAFYDKVSPVFAGKKELIPPPTMCPDCRMQRRLAWRNERKLYHRKCDLTGKQIISMYSSDKKIPVYASDVWWSDRWDPLVYGRDIDFSRSFFEQFRELQKVVPQMSLLSRENDNSDYTNHVYGLKNCYLLSSALSSKDCYYGDWIVKCNDCVDSSHISDSERCYQSQYCTSCHSSSYLMECDRVSNSHFLFDCRNCSNCLFCWNLRNKEYHIQNKPVSREEFEAAVKMLRDRNTLEAAINAFKEMQVENAIHPYRRASQVENSSGDHLIECKNAEKCFDVHRAQDIAYICDAIDITDSYDCNYTAMNCTLNYEDHACDGSQSTCFTTRSYDNHDLLYCDFCHNCSYLFGCIGLHRKQYCILNKQYTKEEYEKLVPKLIEHMKKFGEFGESFPVDLSPFCYNETNSHDFFPLSKEEVLRRGWRWFDESQEKQNYLGPSREIATSIDNVDDAICNQILSCSITGKPYKIIPQELKYYRDMGIPIPTKCPDQRHLERLNERNIRVLWERKCTKCSKAIQTTYAPDRPEIVYCEACYLASVY